MHPEASTSVLTCYYVCRPTLALNGSKHHTFEPHLPSQIHSKFKSLTKDTSSLCTLVRLIRLNGSSLSLSTTWGKLSNRSHSQLTVEPDFLFYNILAFICTCGTHQVVNLLRMYVCSRQWERLDWK